ncbi:NADH-quinone oxidoreductase subunit H [Dermacoccaceae bacterium W4C1]
MSALEVTLRVLAVLAVTALLPLAVGQLEQALTPVLPRSRRAELVADPPTWRDFWSDLNARGRAPQNTGSVLWPSLALLGLAATFALIPLGPDARALTLDVGLLVVLAVTVIGGSLVFVAAQSAGERAQLPDAVGLLAHRLAYALPLAVSVWSFAVLAGSWNLADIAAAWSPWWLLATFPAAAVLALSAAALLRRDPVDLGEQPHPLSLGQGPAAVLWSVVAHAGLALTAALLCVLWLGGWHGPVPDQLGPLWTLLKFVLILVALIWARAVSPQWNSAARQRFWRLAITVALAQAAVVLVVQVTR